ncbi:MAG TPA: glycoside hydrolase family 6 protein [Polyangiaceae bacterium]|jgi:endoglucanase|nr:glycoside hydrolase family 6 protein [Polyangiaceae bacterium]
MTNDARLLPVPGRLLARTALCLLAASSLLDACTKAEDTPRANNPAGAAASPKPADGAGDPGDSFAITDPPAPSKATGNPLAGVKLWVDPSSNAMLRANAIRAKEPEHAAILDKIAKQPQALWLGEWNSNIYRTVQYNVAHAKDDGAVAAFVAYNLPHRDCGQESAGGLKQADDYRRWIRRIAAGINDDAAIVVLEPDALGLLTKENCLGKEQQTERLALIKDAVRVLRQNPKTVVYIDSGHAHWDPAPAFAERLKQAGIEEANGFSLNTSNYVTTEENIAFGKKISALLGGAHFVIDTSRNGTGATPDNQWCNPPGRKIGKAPTTTTDEPLVDGFLWLKRPGESDGECNGGPKAGVFWMEKALDMAQ